MEINGEIVELDDLLFDGLAPVEAHGPHALPEGA